MGKLALVATIKTVPRKREQEIAARGRQQARALTFSNWTKLCFRGVQAADTKMLCRTLSPTMITRADVVIE
jgi:hypothetical protein